MNHYRNLYLLLFLMLFCSKGFAQKQGQAKIDSLQMLIKNYKSICKEPCIHDSIKVNLLVDLALEFNFINPDTSVLLGNQALELSKKINWPMGIGRSYQGLGLFHHNSGDYAKAIEFSSEATVIWKKLLVNDSQNARILYNLSASLSSTGITYVAKGNYPQAQQFYLQALKIAEKTDNKNSIAIAYANIGLVYRRQNQNEKAFDYYSKALKIKQDLGDKNGIAQILDLMGNGYYNDYNYKKALEYFMKALPIYEELKNKTGSARILGNVGAIYSEQKKNTQALDYYKKAMSIQEEIGDNPTLTINLGNIGLLYQTIKNYADAEKYLQRSLALAEEIGSLDDIKTGNENLSNLYTETGKFEKALAHYKKAAEAKDSLFNEEKTEQITRQEMNYEFEKKEAATKAAQEKKDTLAKSELEKQKLLRNSIAGGAGIILISSIFSFAFYKRKRDAEQRQKEMALSLQVSETEMKALRSQMNPHFIFNALQSIQNFLMTHQSEEANTYLLKFSKLMRAVLENSQHREISLKKDKEALELYMQLESIRLPHPFTYEFHIDETIYIEETTIPPLILQPFVENAIWHGLQYKAEPGHINIYISKKDNALYAIVEDNGVGRDMSKQTQQPMLMKKESLGMKLTEERLKILNELKKIKAQFKITDLFTKENTSAGTRVELSLPFEV